MKKYYSTLLLFLLMGATAIADIPNGYYTNAIGKQDEALMTALEGIIMPHQELGYNFLWDCYPYTDTGSDGYYIDMYSTSKYNHDSPHPGGASNVGQGLNREHSFPKSWFGGEVAPMFTDQTMVIPADAYVNQLRSNNPYGVCAGGTSVTNDELGVAMLGRKGTSTYNGYNQTVYEPDDEYKGDFARIYFYMVTCYKSQLPNWPGCDQLDYRTNGYKAFSTWSIQMLMEWHRADPVSPKERARNEAVYKSKDGNKDYGQGNRNPFVDHPELAEYIWGTKQHTPWTGDDTPQEITKRQPVMLDLDTTEVTGTSFRADWTNGGDVSSYTLQVNRIDDSVPVLMLSEGFSGVNANYDGTSDISSSLDTYTDNPGWTGFKLYTAAGHSLKFGTGDYAGYLVSPELDLSNTVSIHFSAKNWLNKNGVSDNSSIIVSCGDISKTIVLTDTQSDYTVVLTGCSEKNIKISGIAPKQRFYVYSIDIYNGNLDAPHKAPRREVIEVGDSTERTVSGITDTCYTVQALADGTFEYVVKAIYLDGTESAWSNIKYVILTGEGEQELIGDINKDGEVDITDVNILINYVLGKDQYAGEFSDIDINHDHELDVADVNILINIILGKN